MSKRPRDDAVSSPIPEQPARRVSLPHPINYLFDHLVEDVRRQINDLYDPVMRWAVALTCRMGLAEMIALGKEREAPAPWRFVVGEIQAHNEYSLRLVFDRVTCGSLLYQYSSKSRKPKWLGFALEAPRVDRTLKVYITHVFAVGVALGCPYFSIPAEDDTYHAGQVRLFYVQNIKETIIVLGDVTESAHLYIKEMMERRNYILRVAFPTFTLTLTRSERLCFWLLQHEKRQKRRVVDLVVKESWQWKDAAALFERLKKANIIGEEQDDYVLLI